MKYRKIGLLILVSVFCLAMTQIAGANAVLKTLYVDGAKVGDSTTGPQELSYIFNRLTIGSEGSKWYRYLGLNGQIDDFSVYNGILSDTKIADHNNANSEATYSAVVLSDSPLLYLKFADASSSNGAVAANAGSSAQLTGAYIGAVTRVASRFGIANNAVRLLSGTGGNGDCVDVGDVNDVIGLKDITIEMWVRLDANKAGDYPRLFQRNNGDTKMGSYGAMYSLDSGAIGTIGGGNTTYASKNIKDNGWHQIVITYKSIVVDAGMTYSQAVKADNPRVYLRFESDTPMDSVDYMWHYYNSKNGLEVWAPTMLNYGGSNMDIESTMRVNIEKAGGVGKSIFLDRTTNPHDGDPAAMAVDGLVAISTVGGAGGNWPGMSFATIGSDANFAFTMGDSTYEFWFKHSPPGRPQMVGPDANDANALSNRYVGTFFQQIGSYNNEPRAPGMGIDANNIRVLCGVRVKTSDNPGDNNETNYWYTGKMLPRTDQQWHQLVLVYDVNGPGDPCNEKPNIGRYNSMDVKLYFDGALAASKTVIDPNGYSRARLGPYLCHMVIGAMNDWGYGYTGLAGFIDEFAIYQGQLDPNRILAHYAAWQPKNCLEAVARGYKIEGDLTGDCYVDFFDFARFGLNWARCNDPVGGANCTANW